MQCHDLEHVARPVRPQVESANRRLGVDVVAEHGVSDRVPDVAIRDPVPSALALMPTSRTRISYYKKSETKGALVRGCPPSDACPRPAGRRCASYEDGIAPDVVVTLFQSSGEHRVDGTALEFRHLSLIRTRSGSSAPNCNSTHINVPRIDRNGVGPALDPGRVDSPGPPTGTWADALERSDFYGTSIRISGFPYRSRWLPALRARS